MTRARLLAKSFYDDLARVQDLTMVLHFAGVQCIWHSGGVFYCGLYAVFNGKLAGIQKAGIRGREGGAEVLNPVLINGGNIRDKRDSAFPCFNNQHIMNSRIAEFDVPISVLTPDGEGNAIGWMDFGKDSLWIVRLQSKDECWIYANTEIQVETIADGLAVKLSEAIKNTSLTIHPPAAAYPAYREALRWFEPCPVRLDAREAVMA